MSFLAVSPSTVRGRWKLQLAYPSGCLTSIASCTGAWDTGETLAGTVCTGSKTNCYRERAGLRAKTWSWVDVTTYRLRFLRKRSQGSSLPATPVTKIDKSNGTHDRNARQQYSQYKSYSATVATADLLPLIVRMLRRRCRAHNATQRSADPAGSRGKLRGEAESDFAICTRSCCDMTDAWVYITMWVWLIA